MTSIQLPASRLLSTEFYLFQGNYSVDYKSVTSTCDDEHAYVRPYNFKTGLYLVYVPPSPYRMRTAYYDQDWKTGEHRLFFALHPDLSLLERCVTRNLFIRILDEDGSSRNASPHHISEGSVIALDSEHRCTHKNVTAAVYSPSYMGDISVLNTTVTLLPKPIGDVTLYPWAVYNDTDTWLGFEQGDGSNVTVRWTVNNTAQSVCGYSVTHLTVKFGDSESAAVNITAGSLQVPLRESVQTCSDVSMPAVKYTCQKGADIIETAWLSLGIFSSLRRLDPPLSAPNVTLQMSRADDSAR